MSPDIRGEEAKEVFLPPSCRIHAGDYAAWYKYATGEWVYDLARGSIMSKKTGRPVPFRPTRDGYLRVTTQVKGAMVTILKHRAIWVVANGILCLPLAYELEVDHINHDRFDCRLVNLRLVTRAMNARYRIKRLSSRSVQAIRRKCAEGKVSKKALALEYGVSPRTIRRIELRERYREVADE